MFKYMLKVFKKINFIIALKLPREKEKERMRITRVGRDLGDLFSCSGPQRAYKGISLLEGISLEKGITFFPRQWTYYGTQ